MGDAEEIRQQLQITCADSLGLMTDHLEDALSPADASRMASHLAGCEPCSVFLSQLRTTIRIAGGALEPTAEADTESQRVERLIDAFRAHGA